MRQMRLFKRQIHDMALIREILEECTVVRLGLTDADGMFIVPVNFGYDFDIQEDRARLRLYIHGAKEGRKAGAVASDPRAAIEMDCRHGIITGDYTCSYSYSYRSIMGNGKIVQLESEEEKRYALSKLMEHMCPDADLTFDKAVLERTAVFRIDVDEFTGKERKQK